MVRYGTSVVKEKVMATASMSKRRQKGGDETAVRERIVEAAFAAFMKSGYATTSTLEIATRARDLKRAGRCVAALHERRKGRLNDALAHRGFVAAFLAAF